MEASFWHQKWATNDINFHQSKTNPLLLKYFDALHCGNNSRIFVPLCGKSLDVSWLLSNGHRVAGVELSGLAVGQLFAKFKLDPCVDDIGGLRRYTAPNSSVCRQYLRLEPRPARPGRCDL